MVRANFDACVALETMAPRSAADAGALVAQFAVRVGVEHPVIAVETQQVAGFLRRRYARQGNVGEDSDGCAVVAVVLVAVLYTVVQHMQVGHGLQHALFLEVRKQQQNLDIGVVTPNVRQRHRQRLHRRRKWRVDDYDVACVQQSLYAVALTRYHGRSRQHVVAIKGARKKGAKTVVQIQQGLWQQMTCDVTRVKAKMFSYAAGASGDKRLVD